MSQRRPKSKSKSKPRSKSKPKSRSRSKPKSVLNSSPGMATFIWGPLFWALIYDIAIIMDHHWNSWTIQTKQQLSQFWSILRHLLPCKYCRQSYCKFYRQDPPTFPFVTWAFKLHNKVNAKLDKPAMEIEKFKRRCHVYGAQSETSLTERPHGAQSETSLTCRHGSFSSANTLWDIQFILALNYDPTKKRAVYKQWFTYLTLIVPYLNYDSSVKCFESVQGFSFLTSKFMLLKHIGACRDKSKPVEWFVHRYAPAIAHNTPEELLQICGPLILKCKNSRK